MLRLLADFVPQTSDRGCAPGPRWRLPPIGPCACKKSLPPLVPQLWQSGAATATVAKSTLFTATSSSRVCSKCFFWLRQLKRVRRSLDAESMKTLVHAFVTSRVDLLRYGNMIVVGAPNSVTNKLQHVLNAAARIVTGTRKYDRGSSHLLHTELHWLDVPERVLYKLALMVHRCLQDN